MCACSGDVRVTAGSHSTQEPASALPKHIGALYVPGSPTKLRVSRRWVLCRRHLCTLSANRVDQLMKDEAWGRTRADGPAAFPGQGLCLPG